MKSTMELKCYATLIDMLNSIELGRRIRNRREQLKLSQTQLANSLHITPQAVSKWELGHSTPDISTIMALATWLSISIDDLVGATPTYPNTIEATVLTSSIRGFANLASKLSPYQVTITLNGIFTTLTDTMLCHQGVPVKYVGDGFLCYFSGPHHAKRAIDTALTIETLPIPNIVIAVVSGPIYVGTVGHPNNAQLDIMGDTVNRAFLLNQWITQSAYSVAMVVKDPPVTLVSMVANLPSESLSVYVSPPAST